MKTQMALLMSLLLLGGCDPGFDYSIKNPCDRELRVAIFHFAEDARESLNDKSQDFFETVPPNSQRGSTMIGQYRPPQDFVIVVEDGPRAGETIQVTSTAKGHPVVEVPLDAC